MLYVVLSSMFFTIFVKTLSDDDMRARTQKIRVRNSRTRRKN